MRWQLRCHRGPSPKPREQSVFGSSTLFTASPLFFVISRV